MIVFSENIQTECEAFPILFPIVLVQAVSPSHSKVACGMKLTTYLCLMPTLRMSGAVSSLCFVPYGVHRDQFTFTFPKLETIFSCYPWQNVHAEYVVSSLYAQAIQLLSTHVCVVTMKVNNIQLAALEHASSIYKGN